MYNVNTLMPLQTNSFWVFFNNNNTVVTGYNDLEIIFLKYKQFHMLQTRRCKSIKYVCYDYKYFEYWEHCNLINIYQEQLWWMVKSWWEGVQTIPLPSSW